MHCYLPMPYIDELAYSVEARYALRLGASKKGQLSVHMSNRLSRPSVILPALLKTVAERSQLLWGKSGEQIANEHTLFAYCARYMPQARYKKSLAKLLSANGHAIHLEMGLTTNNIKLSQYLRYCVSCRKADLAEHGETYWNRNHQIPGVLVCPDHGDLLLDSVARMQPKGFGDYIDATAATESKRSCSVKVLDAIDKEKALMIARRSRDMLLGPIPGWEGEKVTVIYRKAAIERAFIDGAVKLSLPKLEKGFVAFYGLRLLRMVQCDFAIRKNSSWFRNIFRSTHRTFHPLQHVLVQLFLESVKTRINDIIPFGLGPWKCPNPYGEHDEEFPIKDPLIYVGHKHRKYVASAKCKCGYHFTFQRVDDKDPKKLVVSKVMQYGPTWKAEVQYLRSSGLSVLATAKKLGISDSNVRRILQGKGRVNMATENDIKKWRNEWLRLLKKVPERSRKLAANIDRALYLRLLRNDRKWLLSEPRRWGRSTKPPRFIDWEGRDKKWSVMLKRAAVVLQNAVPLKRITRTAMIKEAALGLKILAKYDRYPKCKSVLDKSSESREAFRERREALRAKHSIKMVA